MSTCKLCSLDAAFRVGATTPRGRQSALGARTRNMHACAVHVGAVAHYVMNEVHSDRVSVWKVS